MVYCIYAFLWAVENQVDLWYNVPQIQSLSQSLGATDMSLRFAVLCRVSTEQQAEKGESLEVQEKLLTDCVRAAAFDFHIHFKLLHQVLVLSPFVVAPVGSIYRGIEEMGAGGVKFFSNKKLFLINTYNNRRKTKMLIKNLFDPLNQPADISNEVREFFLKVCESDFVQEFGEMDFEDYLDLLATEEDYETAE